MKDTIQRSLLGFGCCFIVVLASQKLDAQKISNIDFDDVKSATTDSSSKYFYQYLLEKIESYDGYISEREFHYLYYGNAFHPAYSPYGTHDSEESFLKQFKKENFRKAIPYGKAILDDNPVNLEITYHMMVCYHELNVTDTARIYGERYYNMLNAISKSGDGLSPETAFVVLKVNDEYQMLYDMRMASAGQSLIQTAFGPVDKIRIDKKSQSTASGKKVKELYFNVTMLFEQMKSMFDAVSD